MVFGPAIRAFSAVAVASVLGCKSVPEKPYADPLGDVALTTQRGEPLDAREYRGKTLVLSFFFASCPVVCPRRIKLLTEVWHALPPAVRERVEFLSVSVDPENDTPEVLQRFARTHAADLRGFTFARTSREGTLALTTRLAAFDPTRAVGTRPSEHTTAVYVFEAGGRLMQRYGEGADAARLTREVQEIDLLSHSGN